MDVECQCGTVSFKTPMPEPLDLYCCHCSQCRKQSASAFGTSAIFPVDGLFPLPEDLKSKLQIWTRPTKGGGHMDCYFCRVCGSRVFHRAHDKNGTPKRTVSIKGGLIAGIDMDQGKHIWTSSAVVRIPDDVQRWDGSPPATPSDNGNK
ncbi:glutathione-dependent formaldehyde-activating enzyme [Colletotrichum incanum]|uniref:Glutathione-dependent formaldehyde-activating enzyme n=1 Tax=Colletotrichum incanum TaxID=1573173 RepID=A0A161VQ40_COLIC|nr:glutathione-dependent formaldehyde-activating enzyme [Colletotrichum incanum]OHW96546.1 glutathione-dependent formaldehyde-activating enzyme [Colletotrichum incanum]